MYLFQARPSLVLMRMLLMLVTVSTVKHVLRELPSSLVPASCCTVLLEAHSEFIYLLILVVTFGIRILILLIKQGIDRKEARVNARRAEILETFPEPNRRLLQRILKMMHYFFTFI
ncbi:putative Rho GTPase activation protein [Helianthus annuus]|nr:putative Rho GTPase activation protein [Helianthus annuus]